MPTYANWQSEYVQNILYACSNQAVGICENDATGRQGPNALVQVRILLLVRRRIPTAEEIGSNPIQYGFEYHRLYYKENIYGITKQEKQG